MPPTASWVPQVPEVWCPSAQCCFPRRGMKVLSEGPQMLAIGSSLKSLQEVPGLGPGFGRHPASCCLFPTRVPLSFGFTAWTLCPVRSLISRPCHLAAPSQSLCCLWLRTKNCAVHGAGRGPGFCLLSLCCSQDKGLHKTNGPLSLLLVTGKHTAGYLPKVSPGKHLVPDRMCGFAATWQAVTPINKEL